MSSLSLLICFLSWPISSTSTPRLLNSLSSQSCISLRSWAALSFALRMSLSSWDIRASLSAISCCQWNLCSVSASRCWSLISSRLSSNCAFACFCDCWFASSLVLAFCLRAESACWYSLSTVSRSCCARLRLASALLTALSFWVTTSSALRTSSFAFAKRCSHSFCAARAAAWRISASCSCCLSACSVKA